MARSSMGGIAPVIPYGIRGVLWCQGEAGRRTPARYPSLFSALIHDWRGEWGIGNFPFLFVQIAPHKLMTPEIRDAQFLSWKETPNTAMIVTTDVGDAEDIHPARKEPVGQRLHLAARALVYGEDIEYSGPAFESVSFKQEKAVISFSHVGKGLMAKGGALQGFESTGNDGKFSPAGAVIRGESVVASSPEVNEATSVRYGWANVPEVNLFNKDERPASPFRSVDRR